jgi:Protein of unknown function (DUF3551)
MKAALCLFAAAFVAAAIGTPAHAQNYPWCAFYTGPFQATNCGFSTYQQCMATISGIGGYCQPNTTYVPPGRRTRQQAPIRTEAMRLFRAHNRERALGQFDDLPVADGDAAIHL